MKKIINGKKYDTNTATKVAEASSYPRYDLGFWEEELYRKRTGEYFLYGTGGPMSKYSKAIAVNEWTGSEEIMPLTENEAKTWAECYIGADEYEEIFGEVEE